jgi:hypothetical protein
LSIPWDHNPTQIEAEQTANGFTQTALDVD